MDGIRWTGHKHVRDGLVENLRSRQRVMNYIRLHTHSDDRHAKDPELEGNERDILTLGVVESTKHKLD
jgi:hypothetical protein